MYDILFMVINWEMNALLFLDTSQYKMAAETLAHDLMQKFINYMIISRDSRVTSAILFSLLFTRTCQKKEEKTLSRNLQKG